MLVLVVRNASYILVLANRTVLIQPEENLNMYEKAEKLRKSNTLLIDTNWGLWRFC